MHLLTIQEASHRLAIPVKTLRDWVYKRKMPYFKVGKLVRFDTAKIDAWIQSKQINP